RVVNVVSALLSDTQKPKFMSEVAEKQEKQREDFEGRRNKRALLSLEKARANRQTFDWNTVDIPKPEFLGTRVFSTADCLASGIWDLDLSAIAEYFDWGPFFSAWELHGRFPDILTDEVVGTEATKLYADAQKLLARIIAEKRYTAKAVIGFWPANSFGDSVEIYADATRAKVLQTFHFLRQQLEKPADQFNHCLADYIAPKNSGRIDYIGG